MNNEFYDVVVCGGGPAGTAAAISSARNGANVLLLERYGFLGGMATAGLVAPFMQFSVNGKAIVNGIFLEVIDRLKAMDSYGGFGEEKSFDAEALKYVLNEMCLEAKVKIRFHTFVSGVKKLDNNMQEVEVVGKSGKRWISAKVFIDATGDGDVAALSGCEIQIGREGDGLCQPATLMCRVGGVTSPTNCGVEYDVPTEDELPQGRVLYFGLPRKGEVVLNMTRVTYLNALDEEDLSRAEIEARRQVFYIMDYMKKNVKGFENAYLIETAAQIGIRESRRVIGDYILTKEHIFDYKKSEDDIAYCAYKIDIHSPSGQGTLLKELDQGSYYGIPFRCLTPKGLDNLLVAGRSISSTHEAHSSLRIQPTCYAIGEAAGLSAAMAVSSCNGKVRDVKIKELRNRLSL